MGAIENKITIDIDRDIGYIKAPYNKEFITSIKEIGGARWNPGAKAWMIPVSAIPHARDIMMECFGETDLSEPAEYRDVEVTILKRVRVTGGPVQVMGKTLARAYYRDSGADVGEDCELLQGKIYSGGSLTKWQSVIDEGSVFLLHHIPEYIIDKWEGEKNDWLSIKRI